MFRCYLGAVAISLLALPGAALAQSSGGARAATESFDCRELAKADDDVSPRAMFLRSLWASHCYNFQARAVRISYDGVRTLALTHRVEKGVETEVARFLDGPPVAVKKRGSVSQDSSQAALDFTAGVAPGALTAQIVEHYELQPMELERVAGRSAWRLDIEPQDGLRYGYRLWLDSETSLPLKREMIGVDGQILETFQITDLQSPSLYPETLRLGPGHPPADSPWQARWLPDGFTPQPIPPDSPKQSERAEHRMYSDGLTSISLFVEPLAGDQHPLLAGIHRLGISHAAVRHVIHQGRPMQILALGEAPAEVLARIASGVIWDEGSGGVDRAVGDAQGEQEDVTAETSTPGS
ncbi:MAG: negative regulator for alginate biosynthesis MucB [Salinicola sp.]|uniref:MucB/RseB C-terminal domain-containing protein n=1 Tax=uncultured Salinicola sp. TaxID=1193542 RepID=UPI000C94D004|nr:MucB/RseB C-terminal domain-containing protein [uncultured Salinicola sp.]MAM56675.1 negative regulator for alginate biosynthesis MucB [Salinicola sp.]